MTSSSVEVTLRTFIPSEAVGVPYRSNFVNGADAGEGRGRSPLVLDDGGEFVPGADFSTSDAASFRTSQSVILNFGPGGEPLSAVPQDSQTGPTSVFNENDAVQIREPGRGFEWRWDLDDDAEPASQVQLDPLTVAEPSISGPEGDDFLASFQLSSDNPNPPPLAFGPFDVSIEDFFRLFPQDDAFEQLFGFPAPPVPAIDAQIDVTVNQRSDGTIEYEVRGSHDGFPAYELYIDDTFVYTYDPIKAGADPLALASSPFSDEFEVEVDTSGTIPLIG